MINFSFYKFLVVNDGISANDLFQASAFSKGYNGKRAKGICIWTYIYGHIYIYIYIYVHIHIYIHICKYKVHSFLS